MQNKAGNKKSTHRIVHLNYLPRIIGYFLVGLILLSVFRDKLTLGLSICIVIYSLVWPHLAFYLGLRNSNVRQAIQINFSVETFVGGLWISYFSFSLWPTLIIAMAGCANYIITGGSRMVLKVAPFAILGAVLGGLIWGFRFESESSLLTALLCCLFMLVYISVIAYGFYNNAKELYNSKRLLDEANKEIQEKFESANQEIIDRKKVEKELLKVNKDLQSFAYVVSHDLKAPLRGMSSLVHFISEDLSKESKVNVNSNLTLLKGRIVRLNSLINGILAYSKIQPEADDNPSIAIKALLENVLSDIVTPPNLTIDNTIDEELIINFNETYLYEIFTNLLDNAIKYNDSTHPSIRIAYRDEELFHHFSIEDNGVGVPDKFKHKIFEMFQKMEGRDEVEGSGIGLAIVKRILNQNGGDIWVESSPGKHTFFRFIIPKSKHGML